MPSTSITDQVIQDIRAENPRTQHVLRRMVHHLHAFVQDVQPTQNEWETAIDFLTRTGQACHPKRQEFILLSDVLGVTMLVDALQHAHDIPDATESTVQGPFHAPSPPMEMGSHLAQGPERERGETTHVQGRVKDAVTHQPIAQATMEVWQSDDLGLYDVQQQRNTTTPNLRGTFVTGADGTYCFSTIKPASYPVPTDGPVGEYLRTAGRNAMRPAHIHFRVQAPGYQSLVTHIFVRGDPHLRSDAVYAVKDSLIVDFQQQRQTDDTNEDSDYHVKFDIGLTKIPHDDGIQQ